MAFKAKYKLLRSGQGGTAAGGGDGGGTKGGYGGGGDSPKISSSRGCLSSPHDVQRKRRRYNDHSDGNDHNGQHSGQTKLYVRNLSPYTREQDLETAFAMHGRVKRVYLHPKNYGFIVFYEPQDAAAARHHLNGQELFGSRITVEFSRDQNSPQYEKHSGHHDDQYNLCGQQGGITLLFLSNISHGIKEYHIEGLFSQHGSVRRVHLNGKAATVDFYDPRDACDARNYLDGKEFGWSRISVEFAKRVQHSPQGPASVLCYNCGTYGNESSDCKNCQESYSDPRRGRSYSRSLSPQHGRGRSWSSRNHTRRYSHAAGRGLPSRKDNYSRSPKREQAAQSG